MSKADDEMLCSIYQFFALSDEDKIIYLPPRTPNVFYVFNECGDETSNSLLFLCNAAYELMERYGSLKDEFGKLVADISVLIMVLIEQREDYPFIWNIDFTRPRASGPADRIWNVLRRLSEQALAMQGWPKQFPKIAFSEIDRTGSRKRH